MNEALFKDPDMFVSLLVFLSYGLLFLMTSIARRGDGRARWTLALYFGLGILTYLDELLITAGLENILIFPFAANLSHWARAVWPLSFYFLSLFYLRWPLQKQLPWILGLIWTVVATGFAFIPGLSTRVRLNEMTSLDLVPVISWALALGTVLGLAIHKKRRTSRPRWRNKLSYWLMIIVILMLGHLFAAWSPFMALKAGVIILALAGWLMGYAVLGDDLVDMKDLIRHGTSYFVVTVVTVTVYFIAITLVQRVFAEMSLLYSRLVGVSVAAITLTVLYKPLYELSQRVVDSTLFGVRHDHVDTLQDYEEHISQIADLHELAAKSVTLIGHAFGAGRGALLNVEDQGANLELWLIPGLGIVESFSREWPRDHPLLQFFQETGAPLTQRDIERSAEFEDLTERDQAWLDQLGMEVYVPIKAFDELIGIIALGPQSSGKPYDRNDLLLLQDLAKQTALILRNAQRLFELSAINLGIAELNEELQQLDQAKSNFLTIASHELKTPLTLIQGYANILVSLPPADLMDQAKLEHITQGISRGTERLRQIIDDMIDISRLDADAFTLHWKECQLSHVLGVAIDQLRPAAEERDQTIITSGLEEIPPFEGDAQRLHRAFRNVIENAIKYTPDGGQVSISARPLGGEDPEEQFIEVVISDTGIGIDPEDQERIFEKFYRVGDASLHSSSRVQFKGGGPGLGLAISKGIIEAHGGKIWAASEGHDEENCPGSEFHILLMVKAPDQRARFVEEYQLKGQSTLSEDFNL